MSVSVPEISLNLRRGMCPYSKDGFYMEGTPLGRAQPQVRCIITVMHGNPIVPVGEENLWPRITMSEAGIWVNQVLAGMLKNEQAKERRDAVWLTGTGTDLPSPLPLPEVPEEDEDLEDEEEDEEEEEEEEEEDDEESEEEESADLSEADKDATDPDEGWS